MAELAIGIAGIALAWKGILDAGHLLIDLMADDGEDREGLCIRLQASRWMVKDWGEWWGLGRDDGRFHTLEDLKKNFICKIIDRLNRSSEKALTLLCQRYDISTDPAGDNGSSSDRGLPAKSMWPLTE